VENSASREWRLLRHLRSAFGLVKSRLGHSTESGIKKNAKILKYKILKWPLWLLPTRLLKLSKAATKKAID